MNLAERIPFFAKGKSQARSDYSLGFSALLCGVFLFTGANAVLTTLVVIRASELDFNSTAIGLLTSGYFGGFIAGCIFGGGIVARVGHIRTFAGLAGIATICALLYPIIPIASIWILLRVVSGFSHSILQMTIESWLTSSSTEENRSGLISVYRITDLMSVTLAQFALVLKDSGPFLLFTIVGICICLSLTPIVFSKTTGPAKIAKSKPDVKRLIEIAPMAAAGAFAMGLVSAGFWGLSPVYLTKQGFSVDVVALFISAVIIGGAIFQYPIGKLSDKYDRRLIIMSAALAAALACLIMPLFGANKIPILLTGVIFGGALMPIYALSVSHASDAADPEEFVPIAGAVLLSFGAGAVIGPTLFSITMGTFGDAALFIFMAIVLGGLIAFGVWRRQTREARADADKDDFMIVTRSTPEVFEFDPRSNQTAEETANTSEAGNTDQPR